MLILRMALPLNFMQLFDYCVGPDDDRAAIAVGIRVLVPFGKKQLVGIVVEVTDNTAVPPDKLKAIIKIIDTVPLLPPDIMALCSWVASYYHYPVGQVLVLALPPSLRKQEAYLTSHDAVPKPGNPSHPPIQLNQRQQAIVDTIISNSNVFTVIVIDGVTGSGKTAVYLQTIEQVVKQGKQALVLVPEITLTPQTISYFAQGLSVPVVAWHSRLTAKERMRSWSHANSGVPSVIIGTRSAVFMPIPNLGIVVIDEEHDLSFKQQDKLRYHGRDVAIWRARATGVPVVLGSATPALETITKAWSGAYQYFRLPERAGAAQAPELNLIDIKGQAMTHGLSQTLLTAMDTHISNGNQALLLLNRRGFAPVLLCHNCAWVAECDNCDARLTYHLRLSQLICHHCEAQYHVLAKCPNCASIDLRPLGMGTEKLALGLQHYFPEASIVRLDRDTTKGKHKVAQLVGEILAEQHQIIIGTQMVAKGHHFPKVTMVGIVDADYGLFSADFRASERLGQLIMQVAGRAGRATSEPGEVFIQTHHPQHPLLKLLIAGDYHDFAKAILAERQHAGLPPFTALASIHASGTNNDKIAAFLERIKQKLHSFGAPIKIMGPINANMPRKAGQYHWRLLLQARYRTTIQQVLTKLDAAMPQITGKSSISYSLDVDPLELA